YADKYAVRSYVQEIIGEEYLIPLIAVYNNTDEINWELLPDQFVLKCTHGSGTNIICTDKNELNVDEAKKKLDQWMKKSWYWYGREWPYKHIKPRIICEPFISEDNNVPDDYKVMCFNGKAKLVQVHSDRFIDHKVDFYDTQWKRIQISGRGGVNSSNKIHTKPENFEKMLQLSERITGNRAHIRIDWFIVNNNIYFGEITFFETSGFILFDDEKDDYLLGSWIELPIKLL
ncbi:MAG: ATP-grasp fold amidoligase family protein, partial [Bacillota bacterium]|nr:ATP-grasp fold amidoligase family protein [Bacillota bacterium]